MDQIDIEEFSNLFRGNQRSFGRWIEDKSTNGVKGKNLTEKTSYRHSHFESHLKGDGNGIGIVPIMDDATCWWGCIDIDNHGSGKDINFDDLLERIGQLHLPLIVCRSKGGGAHCYLFGIEPLRAANVYKLLCKWALDLDAYSMATNGQVDIFPKQERLAIGADGERALGNYVNLPYYKADDTIRYGVGEGHGKLSLKAFLALGNAFRVTQAKVNRMLNAGDSEAPPCIQHILANGIDGNGGRNDTMYSMVVYLKKAKPDTYRDDAVDINQKIFDVPLDQAELKKIVNSASRRDYRYKCGEEPLKSLCDSKTCLKRRYGISQSDVDTLNAEKGLPEFSNLIKWMGDPPRYTFDVNGIEVKDIDVSVVMRFSEIKRVVYQNSCIVLPTISQKMWEAILTDLTSKQRVMEIPDEASPSGIIKSRLDEFVARVDLTDDGKNPRYDDLDSGLPVGKEEYAATEDAPAVRVAVFRGIDFVEFLRAKRSEELKGSNLWMAMKNACKATHMRVRINGKPRNVWCVPLPEMDDFRTPDFTPEF